MLADRGSLTPTGTQALLAHCRLCANRIGENRLQATGRPSAPLIFAATLLPYCALPASSIV